MAEFGPLSEPVTVSEIDLVAGIPVGDLVDAGGTIESVDGIVGMVTQRFPVPPSAGGFLKDTALELVGPGVTGVISSALSVEGSYMEPTRGQIWPRIG